MTRIRIVLTFLVCQLMGPIYGANSQVDSVYLEGTPYFGVEANGFFDNLEFFNSIQKGYTLVGFNLAPHLGYNFTQGSRVFAGFHLVQLAGEEKPHRFAPIVSLQSRLNSWLQVTLGTLDSKGRSSLPEPLFKPERVFTHLPETGLQFVFSTRPFQGEAWINWENMIFPKDTVQEEFTVGLSGRLGAETMRYQFHIPFYALFVHQGGQINITDEPVSTLANMATGIDLNLKFGASALGLNPLFFLGRDFSPNPHHIFKKGWAFYPNVYFTSRSFYLSTGFWNGHQMILPRGQEIFGSISLVNPTYNRASRTLATFEARYEMKAAKGLTFSSFFKLYYDTHYKLADYRFGVIMFFNHKQTICSGKG